MLELAISKRGQNPREGDWACLREEMSEEMAESKTARETARERRHQESAGRQEKKWNLPSIRPSNGFSEVLSVCVVFVFLFCAEKFLRARQDSQVACHQESGEISMPVIRNLILKQTSSGISMNETSQCLSSGMHVSMEKNDK